MTFLTILLATAAATPQAVHPQDAFFASLSALCGRAFEGRIVSSPVEADRDFAGRRLFMHVRDCRQDEIRVPFRVGDDRSRTWVVRRRADRRDVSALSLHHQHLHADGSEDRLSNYGGSAITDGTETRQEFPVDSDTRHLFERENIPQSMTNVWALETVPGTRFAYELRRPGRFFRIEFDLSRPVAPPD